MDQERSATINPRAIELAQDAVRKFHAECFWFWDRDVDVSRFDIIHDVIDGLRRRGGRKEWFVAQRIAECL